MRRGGLPAGLSGDEGQIPTRGLDPGEGQVPNRSARQDRQSGLAATPRPSSAKHLPARLGKAIMSWIRVVPVDPVAAQGESASVPHGRLLEHTCGEE